MDFIKKELVDESGAINFIGKLSIAIAIALLAFFLVRIIDKLFYKKILDKEKGVRQSKIKTVGSIFNSFVKIVLYSLAIILILDLYGVNTNSFLAVAGVGGIAIAFAAQSIVADVITGAFILFENQYNIGDWVTIGSKSGTVIEMGMRVVKLKDLSGLIHIIPNGKVDMVTNHSKGNMFALVEVEIPLKVEYDKACDVIEEVLDRLFKESNLFIYRPEIIGMTAMNSFRYVIRVQGPTKNVNMWPADRLIRKELVKALQENNMVYERAALEAMEVGNNGKL